MDLALPAPREGRPSFAEVMALAEATIARRKGGAPERDPVRQESDKAPPVRSRMFWRYIFIYAGSVALLAHVVTRL